MYKLQHTCRKTGALLFAMSLLFSGHVNALTIDLGGSLSQPVVEVRNNDGTVTSPDPKDKLVAENAAETSLWPYISLQSRERYLGVTNIGYTLSAMFWYFSVDKQKDGDKLVDYDTSMKGYYAYLTPTIYYRFGDRYIMESKDKWNWTVGAGIGVGFLVADGKTYTNYSASPSRESIHVDNAALSIGVFVEAARNQWFVRFSSYGPSSATINSKYNVHLSDNSLVIGKRIDITNLFN